MRRRLPSMFACSPIFQALTKEPWHEKRVRLLSLGERLFCAIMGPIAFMCTESWRRSQEGERRTPQLQQIDKALGDVDCKARRNANVRMRYNNDNDNDKRVPRCVSITFALFFKCCSSVFPVFYCPPFFRCVLRSSSFSPLAFLPDHSQKPLGTSRSLCSTLPRYLKTSSLPYRALLWIACGPALNKTIKTGNNGKVMRLSDFVTEQSSVEIAHISTLLFFF